MIARIIIVLVQIFMFSSLCAQVQETRNLTLFTKVKVSDNITITLIPAQENKIEIFPKNIMNEKIVTSVINDEFVIKTEGILNDADIKAILYYTQPIVKITPTFGGLAKCDIELNSNELIIDANLDGFTNLLVNTKKITVYAGQGSDVYVSGKSEVVNIDASSGSKVKMEKLVCTDATVKSILGAKVWISPSQQFDAKAVSGGKIYYRQLPAGNFSKNYSLGGQILIE